MKDKELMVEKIRSQYTEAEHTDLDALKALEVLRRAGAPYSKLYAQTDSGKMEELPV